MEEKKISPLDTKRLMVKLNQITSQYIGKIMYALFFMSILDTLVSFVILSPVMRLVQNDANMLTIKAATFFLAFVAICAWLTFQFGFAVMLLQMTRRKNTNLGYIFIGFKCFNHAGKVIVAFGALISLLAVIARFAAKFVFLKIKPDFSFEAPSLDSLQNVAENTEQFSSLATDTLLFLALFLLFLLALSLFVLIRFVFVFQLHFDNPSLKISELFKKSAKMMHKNVFRLIAFALRAGGKQLAIALFLALIVNFFPEEKHSGLSVLVFLLDIAYFVNFYTALVRIYLTVPVLYEEQTKTILPLTEHTENTENRP
ncbi:MAG: hypothetical protein IJ558_12565 [Treponema sp.]|nr:hypothetical protein [Treponema sp.]